MKLSMEVEAYLDKARHALEVTEKLMAGGDFGDAAGKAYFAMFYAAQALLKAHGIEVTTHSGMASMLGHHFAKPGLLDPKFHRMFLNARRAREIADYGIFEVVLEPVAILTLKDSRVFIDEVERLLAALP
ncbi:MAG: HEPN domain-containing protein [Deltaproteobacteria bacterium]|nr:HEPN domain-containing protein [Deltaproteobacteria bacterium]